MDPSDIKYVLALTRRDLLLYELRAMRDSLSATISKLSNLHLWMKTLERDLPTLNSDSSNLALSRALQSLSLGKGNIESALEHTPAIMVMRSGSAENEVIAVHDSRAIFHSEYLVSPPARARR